MDQVEEIVRKSIFNDTYTKGAPESDSKIHDEFQWTIKAKAKDPMHMKAEEAIIQPTHIEEEISYRASLAKTQEDYQYGLVSSKPRLPSPTPHPKWKLMRVISGHLGWVRALAVDPTNDFFVSGSADRIIKVWDLASGTLKLSLTGHISTIRALALSSRHPYLFSAGEDKQIKCWDLECNKVIRHYHGHLSGIYSMALHPTLDLIVTAGRDATARVWDMRTRQCVHVLSGHSNTIADVKCQEGMPQIITSSMDSTVRLWDLAAGKTMSVLTHHKKSVRSLVISQTDYTFASASADNIKRWKCPQGQFLHNFTAGNDQLDRSSAMVVNTMSVNQDDVLFTGADDGRMMFWDWKSGTCFQSLSTTVQPGSLDCEAGVYCSTFDMTGLRLITGEADKTIKIWKEVQDE